MSKKKFLIVLLFLFIFPAKAYAADVNLNEIYANPPNESDEFIELYNNTSGDIQIGGWKVSDKVKTYTIPDNTSITANGFYTLKKGTSGLELNNNDEEVFLKKETGDSVDNFSYSDTSQGKSWSRVPNGTGSFTNNVDVTEGASNASAPTATTAPTSSPSNTPTPTKTPTPAPTATPTKAPTATPTKTATSPTPTIKVTPSPTIDPNVDLKVADSSEDKVFGDNSESPTPSEGEVLGASTSSTPFLFIALGLIFLVVCGILVYLQFGDRILLRFRKKSE
jgi:hypothetical protein